MRGEPAAVPEIPHPKRLAPSVPFAESDSWYACGRPPFVRQGWKLYVPLTMVNAREVIERLAPVVSEAGYHFKYIKSIDSLRKLNAGTYGYVQIGKCFVVYLPQPDGDFIERLKRTLAPYRDRCPAVPCARPFGDRLPLYYRYGSYAGTRLEVRSVELDDDRETASAAVPDGVEDALAPFTTPIPSDPAVDGFLRRFPVFEALMQQGKCGLFHGMNLDSETFQEVVLKVGYHRGQVQPDGSDGCTYLRRELAFYRRLAERDLDGLAPRLIDSLDVPRKVILVLEYIQGMSLLVHRMQDTLTVEHLEACWSLLDRFHAGGVYLGDAKLANFLVTEDGDLRALDFEAAGVLGEKPPAIRTFFIHPDPGDPQTGDRLHFLASVLYPYEEGRYSWKDRHVELADWLGREPSTEAEAWALERLGEVLAVSRPPRTATPAARSRSGPQP